MSLRLTERDERILRHVARYRLTTPETIWRLYFQPEGKSEEAVKSTLRRLWQGETPYLAAQPLFGRGRAVYYHLTPAGAAYLGFEDPSRIGHGFDKADVRATHYGRLLFCCHGAQLRPKFLDAEFDACFPGLRGPDTELRARFYNDAYYLDVDATGTRRLGVILIDTGRDLVDLARRTVTALRGALHDFLVTGRLAVALVFSSEPKLRHARYLLGTYPLGEHIHVVLEAHPGLRDLIATAA